MDKKSMTESIKENAYELGYELCGVIPADSLKRLLNIPGQARGAIPPFSETL